MDDLKKRLNHFAKGYGGYPHDLCTEAMSRISRLEDELKTARTPPPGYALVKLEGAEERVARKYALGKSEISHIKRSSIDTQTRIRSYAKQYQSGFVADLFVEAADRIAALEARCEEYQNAADTEAKAGDRARAENARLVEVMNRLLIAAEFHSQTGVSDHVMRYAHESTARLIKETLSTLSGAIDAKSN